MDYKQKSAIADKLAEVLDTHDKRYMFVSLFFPGRQVFINLEGTPQITCHDIVDEVINKCGMVKQMHEGLTKLFPTENFDYVIQ